VKLRITKCLQWYFTVCVSLLWVSSAISQDNSLRDVVVANITVPSPGYIFICPVSIDSISIVDNTGRHIWKDENHFTANLMVGKNGTLTHYNGPARAFVRRNAKMEVIDTLRASDGYDTDFHELLILDKNKYLITGLKNVPTDMSLIVPGGRTDAIVLDHVIQIRTFKGETLFEWHSIDHFPVTVACDDVSLTQFAIDPVHINSVIFDADSNLIVSCRNMDAVIKIDFSTGNVIWVIGGSKCKVNQFKFLNDTVNSFVGFTHQHSVSRLRNGNIIMFDNGNLKAIQESRVVEYQIDETNKTIKKIWEYRGTESRYAPTMGSVQELSNGRLVVGWGSSSSPFIGEEIDKLLNVYTTWSSPSGMDVNVYRLRKYVFFMTGFEKTITTPGVTNFSDADSNTYVSIDASTVNTSVYAVVERHSYQAHNFKISTGTPCTTYPMRWTVRYTAPTSIEGNLKFALGGVAGIVNPSVCTIYRRTTEGTGDFFLVTTTYDALTKTITAPLASGEYVIGSNVCLNPKTILPQLDSVTSLNKVTFTWSRGIENSGYVFQVSTNPEFSTLLINKNVTDTFTTADIDRGVIYFWRVSSKRNTEPPTWNGSSFISNLNPVTLLSPILLTDTVSFGGDSEFLWTVSKNATQYRLRVTNGVSGLNTVDTVIADTSALITIRLPGSTGMLWKVQAIRGERVSAWSAEQKLYTGIIPPILISPLDNEIEVNSSYAELKWAPVAGVTMYRLRATSTYGSSTTTLFDGVVSGTSRVFSALPNSSTVHWQVLSIGKYGEGQWSFIWSFRTTTFNAFPKAITISPKLKSGIENVRFVWNKVKGATYYTFQLTTKTDFSKPETTITDIADTSVDVGLLRPETSYRWRIVGLSDIGNGAWSDAADFFTSPDSIPLYPIYPKRGDTIYASSDDAIFTEGSTYSRYSVTIDSDSTFATPSVYTTLSSPVRLSGLQEGARYWWYVTGIKPDSTSRSGIVSNFSVGQLSEVEGSKPPTTNPTIKLQNDVLYIFAEKPIESVYLFDIKGNTIFKTDDKANVALGISLNDLANGIVLVRINYIGGNSTKSIILVQH